jgi:hemoglobin
MKQTIFERYGGFSKVSRVVMDFYDKILESPITSPYFAKTDMRNLIDHQTKFIASIMGGPTSYSDDHLQRAHFRYRITEEAFRESLLLLKETLEDHDFSNEDIQAVSDEFMSRMGSIVARGKIDVDRA